MQHLLLRILIFAPAGAMSGTLGLIWLKFLLRRRQREYPLGRKAEIIICAAALAAGGIAGALLPGWVFPLCAVLLIPVCVVVCSADWVYRVIPNPAVLALFILKLAFGIPTLFGAENFLPFSVWRTLGGFAACFALFILPGFFGKNVGAGDIKLAAAMGFFLSFDLSLIAVAIMGLLVIGYCMVQQRMPFLAIIKTQIPMGPFIIAGLFTSFILSGIIL